MTCTRTNSNGSCLLTNTSTRRTLSMLSRVPRRCGKHLNAEIRLTILKPVGSSHWINSRKSASDICCIKSRNVGPFARSISFTPGFSQVVAELDDLETVLTVYNETVETVGGIGAKIDHRTKVRC